MSNETWVTEERLRLLRSGDLLRKLFNDIIDSIEPLSPVVLPSVGGMIEFTMCIQHKFNSRTILIFSVSDKASQYARDNNLKRSIGGVVCVQPLRYVLKVNRYAS
eukprot:m.176083 g.176083  ORF g.176083 m.176083 type:complete len:105 (+) comp31842_c0_seq1:2545-2859(+)